MTFFLFPELPTTLDGYSVTHLPHRGVASFQQRGRPFPSNWCRRHLTATLVALQNLSLTISDHERMGVSPCFNQKIPENPHRLISWIVAVHCGIPSRWDALHPNLTILTMSPLYPHDILLLLNDCLLYMIVVTNTISTLYHMVIYEQSSSNKNLNYIYIG